MAAPSCQHHPQTAAVGICVRCSARLCDACITKLDGIACLLAEASVPPAAAGAGEREADVRVVWLSLALGVALLAGLAFSTLTAILPSGVP